MDSSITLPLNDAEAPGSEPRTALRSRIPQGPIRVAAGILVLLAVLAIGADRLTSSPALCGSCHEMAARTAAWKTSPHVKVDCVACHVGSRAWYALPQALYARGGLLARDVAKHFGGGPMGPVDSRPAGVAPMSDGVCLQCHDPNRKPTAGLGILIDHPKHAKRNGECVSCHITVAHPTPSRGTALSFMAQCFKCHGMAKGAKAPGRCGLCHPADFKLRPASHGDGKWTRAHGGVSMKDPRQCEMCHVKSYCDKCHGLQMPHPKGWGRRTGHPVYAARGRQVCTKCHEDKPDMCSMCHHKSYEPGRGTWVQQHFLEVEVKGAYYCLESCHSPVYCSRCHVRGEAASRQSAPQDL